MANQELGKPLEGFIELPGFKKGRVRDIRAPIQDRDALSGKPKNKSLLPSRSHRTAALAKVPQAVVKITGYSKGSHQHVREHIAYITRNGKLPLECENGDVLEGKKTSKELVQTWGIKHLGPETEEAFKNGQLRRKVAHMMVSSPEGASPEKLREITRDFLHRQFGETTRYAFAVHDDTKNSHAHIVLAMRGYDGKKLRIGRAEIQNMREVYAEVATEHGVSLSASRRVDLQRDQAPKEARDNKEFRIAKRGESSVSFASSVRRAYEELIGRKPTKTKAEIRFDEESKDVRKTAGVDAAFYADLARENPAKAKQLEKLSALHAKASASQDNPKSAREQFRELVIAAANGEKTHPMDRAKNAGEPTVAMRVLAETIAKEKKLELPENYEHNFATTRAFLDTHAKREIGSARARQIQLQRQNRLVELE